MLLRTGDREAARFEEVPWAMHVLLLKLRYLCNKQMTNNKVERKLAGKPATTEEVRASSAMGMAIITIGFSTQFGLVFVAIFV